MLGIKYSLNKYQLLYYPRLQNCSVLESKFHKRYSLKPISMCICTICAYPLVWKYRLSYSDILTLTPFNLPFITSHLFIKSILSLGI